MLFIVVDAFSNLDEFIKRGVTFKIVVSYYLFLIPSLLVQILPISALVSILYTLGSLNRHNEITALRSSGLSSVHILFPYLFFGLILSFFIALFAEKIVPKATINSTAIMDGLIQRGKRNLDERALRDVTLFSIENRMIYAKEFELQNNDLYDVVIFENHKDKKFKSKLIAKKAHYANEEWTFTDVFQYKTNRRGTMVGKLDYSPTLSLKLPEKPRDFLIEASRIEFMSAKQLREYIGHFHGAGQRVIRKLSVEFHNKVAFPFISFIVILLGTPLAMKTRRGSTLVGIGTSVVVVLLYYSINSICLALGKGGVIPPAVAGWSSNVFFACVGVFLIKKTI